jgi:hypothetical protein
MHEALAKSASRMHGRGYLHSSRYRYQAWVPVSGRRPSSVCWHLVQDRWDLFLLEFRVSHSKEVTK